MDAVADLINSNALRVAAYGLAALLCFAAGMHARASRGDDGRPAAFWLVIAVVLAVLAVSRAVELGPLISDEGREFARDRGWYDDRRDVQRLAVEAIVALGFVLCAVGFLWLFLTVARQYPLAFIALVFLVCYVAVRAISLHQVDAVLYNRPIEGVRINALLELAGIALMCIAATVALTVTQRQGAPAAAA